MYKTYRQLCEIQVLKILKANSSEPLAANSLTQPGKQRGQNPQEGGRQHPRHSDHLGRVVTNPQPRVGTEQGGRLGKGLQTSYGRSHILGYDGW